MEEDKLKQTLEEVAADMLAEYGLSNNFTIVSHNIIYNNDREQFLYELKGGKALYDVIYKEYSTRQWDRMYQVMTAINKEKSTPGAFHLEAFKQLYLQMDWPDKDDV